MPFGDSISSTDPFLAFLGAQRAAFRADLPRKLDEMGRLWEGIVRGEGGAAAIADLERHAHNLAGSGATFGLRDLSAAARVLETAVQGLRLPPPPCDSRLDVNTALRGLAGCIT